MPANEISVTVESNRATVALVGEHEAFSADRVGRQLEGLIAEGVGVRIDLSRAEFVDSTLIGTLLAARRRAAAAGVDFQLALGPHTGWPVRRMLDVTGLAARLDVVG